MTTLDAIDADSALGELLQVAPTEWESYTFDNDGRIHLLPFISELYILTKERGLERLGEIMNHAQRDFVTRCEIQLNETGRIRACVLKARQIGMSTVIEAIIFALSVMYQFFNSLVISHEKDSAEALLGMTRRYWDTYTFKRFHDEKYSARTQLSWSDLGSNIQIATAKNLNAGRSRTIHALHASEVAFYDDPETLMTGLRQAIPTNGLSAVFYESTANGIGNFFHRECVQAMKGQSEYEFFFYPWHEHPEYVADFLPDREVSKYLALDELDEEEQELRKAGISDSRLIWRRYAIENLCQGDIDKFHQEYPFDPHQAFISTGRNVFPLPDLLVHYQPRKGVRGRLVKSNNRVTFVPDDKGWLTIYAKPSRDIGWGVYLIGADPTHTVSGDNASAQVINRRTKEQVAVYSRKVDPVAFGKDLQLLGTWYHQALIAPEREGPGYATVGVLAGDYYPNLFQSTNIISSKGHVTDAYGWSTNSTTKHVAISHLKRSITEPLVELAGQQYGLVIHHEATLAEMRDYVTTEDGKGYENGEGSRHDDNVMSLAIAVAVDALELPPPPYSAQERDEHAIPVREVREVDGKLLTVDPSAPRPVDDTEESVAVPWEKWGEAEEAWKESQ